MNLSELHGIISSASADRLFLLTDSTIAHLYEDRIQTLSRDLGAALCIIPAGEDNKNLNTLAEVLTFLSDNGATRRSLLICIGGGMATDLGGFAAAIFKRGIRHINIATTILGAVDAAVGGKTAIDFNNLKNEIGAFHLPIATLFDADTFATLPDKEILSGFGEIAKTALLAGRARTMECLAVNQLEASADTMTRICAFCRDYKMDIVEKDPTEKGLRKVLNLGHTAGHAMESYLISKGQDIPHGIAIAHGNLVSLILSNILLGLDSKVVSQYSAWLKEYYPRLDIGCKDYASLWEIALHDKKNNIASSLSFTLLEPNSPDSTDWQPVYDRQVNRQQLEEALDIYRELLGQ
ncbi:MAG: 3-dehydroquinate synthase [Muribaculaceae bacterium]|nr:3-dehydroquinate synthase [Muribaculaceae bacterium]